MILLDTNVISEVIKPQPDSRVAAWMTAQPRRLLRTSAIVRAEILYGVAVMTEGKRKQNLTAVVIAVFEELGPALPFTARAATHFASVTARRRQLGRPIGSFDALIAATALEEGARIATRDIEGFSGCGITLINPWDATPQ